MERLKDERIYIFSPLTVTLAIPGNFFLFLLRRKIAVFLDVDVERGGMGDGTLRTLEAKVKPQHDCADADVGPKTLLNKLPENVRMVRLHVHLRKRDKRNWSMTHLTRRFGSPGRAGTPSRMSCCATQAPRG